MISRGGVVKQTTAVEALVARIVPPVFMVWATPLIPAMLRLEGSRPEPKWIERERPFTAHGPLSGAGRQRDHGFRVQ